jgi:carboxypeptidase Taq
MLETLRERLAVVADLQAAARLLEWDQETYMPPGAAEARAHQLATIKTLAHAQLVGEEVTTLLASIPVQDLDDPLDVALVRVTQRDVDRASRRPPSLVARQARATARALEAWKRARATDDFPHFAPHLNEILDLAREEADALGYDDDPYDALLEEYEPGMTTAEVARTFAALRRELVPMVDAIAAAAPVDDSVLHRRFDVQRQWDFGVAVARAVGYDFERGRQDRSAHPFSTSFSSPFDVRITTRLAEDFFSPAFFGTLHEVGHALYEQGIDPAVARTPLADGTSLGIHESQSRLWENLVGRGRPFWRWAYPLAREVFPDALAGTDEDAFHRAVNRVEPTLIRVEADEVTYGLHVMLRFELETALLRGDLAVTDLPEAWNERMREYLGVVPETDADGCLQDIHWALGAVGYFPTYALGSLMSVQIWDALLQDVPDLEDQIASGEFAPLLGWLRENVHHHGRARSATEILEDATGGGLSAKPWLSYARRKFGALYGIDL